MLDVHFGVILLTAAFYLVLNRTAMAFPAGVVSYVSLGSLSTLVELWWGIDSRVTAPSLAAGILLSAYLMLRPNHKVALWGLVYGASAGGLLFAIDQASRYLGLSSIAFTDGHTLLTRSYEFSIGNTDLILGSTGLKRGFGLSALHAQGFEGEYLVGLMPFIMVAAIVATLLLLLQVFGRNSASYVSVGVMVVSSLFVEAISRHFYLVNSHSLSWLGMAILVGVVLRSRERELRTGEWLLAVVTFSSMGFLRVDYVVIFTVLGFLIATFQAKLSPIWASIPIPIMALSSFSWIVTVTDRFPFGGTAGLYLYLILGTSLPILLTLLVRRGVLTSSVFLGRPYWYLIGAMLLFFLSQVSLVPSLQSLFINLMLGEGLWGGFFYFVIVLVLVSVTLLIKEKHEVNLLARLFFMTLLTYLILKTFDNFEVRGVAAGFSRIGFGDSFNRTLIIWLPFVFILVAWVQHQITRKSQQTS